MGRFSDAVSCNINPNRQGGRGSVHILVLALGTYGNQCGDDDPNLWTMHLRKKGPSLFLDELGRTKN